MEVKFKMDDVRQTKNDATITITLPETDCIRAKEYCKKKKITVSYLMRSLLTAYLDSSVGQNGKP